MISSTGENLIFIFSLPRSGSTLLSAILGNHPQVTNPQETWILLRLAEVYGDAADNKAFDDVIAAKAVKAILKEDQFNDAARAFALTAYNRILTESGYPSTILVDKTPRYYHIIDWIQTLFPQAKRIWLKRNPLDVAASYKTRWNRPIESLVGKEIDPYSFDFITGLDRLREFFNHHGTYQYEICYEDLVTRPEQQISKLCEFCGFDYQSSMLALYPESKGLKSLASSELGDRIIHQKESISTDSIDAWKIALNPSEISQLTGVIGRDIFHRMGYQTTIDLHPELFPKVDEKSLYRKRQKLHNQFIELHPNPMGKVYSLEFQLRKCKADLAACQADHPSPNPISH